MIAKDDIVIRKSILHILDTTHARCLLSDHLLDPGPDLYEFIRTHIYKIVSSDDTKDCEFNPDTSPVYELLSEWDEGNDESFIKTSQDIAGRLYDTMTEGMDIPPADLLFVSFQAEGQIYLALLKMNYRESYTHEISEILTPERENADEGTAHSGSIDAVDSDTNAPYEDSIDTIESEAGSPHADGIDTFEYNNIVPSRSANIRKTSALLPAAGSRIPEAIIINLTDLHIRLLEKRYEINGEKVFYLSERFLVCHTSLPPRKKLNILTKVINQISNKYDGADLKTKMDTKSALQKEYVDRQSFNVEEIGTALFGNSPEKKAEYDEKMEEYDLQYDDFSVLNESTVKKLEKQIMVTDSGIEISIPMEVYNKLANVEVSTDVTGKSTIIIRNIDNLILK